MKYISKLMSCLHCKKMVKVPGHRHKSFKYCSRYCLWHYKNIHDRKKLSCATCTKPFTVIAVRATTARYCSKQCYYKSMNKLGSVLLTCCVCGVEFRRSPCKVKPSNQCCSITCRGLLKRTDQPGTRTSIRDWLKRRGLMLRCHRCGYDTHPEILNVHHHDHNGQNHSPDNLEVLCPNCHAIEHFVKP